MRAWCWSQCPGPKGGRLWYKFTCFGVRVMSHFVTGTWSRVQLLEVGLLSTLCSLVYPHVKSNTSKQCIIFNTLPSFRRYWYCSCMFFSLFGNRLAISHQEWTCRGPNFRSSICILTQLPCLLLYTLFVVLSVLTIFYRTMFMCFICLFHFVSTCLPFYLFSAFIFCSDSGVLNFVIVWSWHGLICQGFLLIDCLCMSSFCASSLIWQSNKHTYIQ